VNRIDQTARRRSNIAVEIDLSGRSIALERVVKQIFDVCEVLCHASAHVGVVLPELERGVGHHARAMFGAIEDLAADHVEHGPNARATRVLAAEQAAELDVEVADVAIEGGEEQLVFGGRCG
jgi:hypothetical protein